MSGKVFHELQSRHHLLHNEKLVKVNELALPCLICFGTCYSITKTIFTQQQIKLVTKQVTFAVQSMVYYIYIKEQPEGLLATLRATFFDISL